jgi:MerR family transcriptional regulator, mercuric resistance operon regulatory protein
MAGVARELTIGRLARAAGVGIETIRFYQRKGLIPEPARPLGGIRYYGEPEVDRVRFIKAAQRLGFALDEVAELLRLEDGTRCAEARYLAEHKLADVRARLADLQRIEASLAALVTLCETGRGKLRCPLIDTLRRC